ncbi:C4-dicarboxylate ABC transporter [Cylindrospermopsis raciborskii C04]|uniref:C4-dicarboxylate ABC transporter n=2 Tax=Cylindrospermopsis raciborskii C07 TaxID=2014886 RepID=A0ABX4WHY0_9CYAN|nr:C4-dicarboxylate ABC transporter [Cylindrospermopsis raciborskii C04]PNJ91155.1 C4-dicarboxylate ABC transporter [Cylindrospermopsis raciborskii C03]PNJ91881.1 C4-dicarboxylate ABC transporter [Cylindrospermopsis raciborskii C07]
MYLFTSLGNVNSYCCLLRIDFDDIFADLLFLECFFTLYVYFYANFDFYLSNFPP